MNLLLHTGAMMNSITTILAILMIADALFALTNLAGVESKIKDFFPNLNIKQLAIVEGGAGIIILLLKASTNSLF